MPIMFWIWLGITIVAVIVELGTQDLSSIWFAGGGIVAMLMSISPKVPWWASLIVFLGRELIERGQIYIALPPLYKITNKNNIDYAWTDEELREKAANLKNIIIQRFKGLGEMNPEQLWETTMNPMTRTLIKVNIEDFTDADDRIATLMGDDVESRREWIENNVSFEYEDNFTLEEVESDE